MTINDVYETSLYLSEKLNDSTGFIDSEYKKQHKKKAEFLIKQAIRKFAKLENVKIIDPDFYLEEDNIPLDNYILKNIIPCYVGAMLCAFDRENDKYNLLISEYQNMVETYKHDEETMDVDSLLEGMC